MLFSAAALEAYCGPFHVSTHICMYECLLCECDQRIGQKVARKCIITKYRYKANEHIRQITKHKNTQILQQHKQQP